MVWYRGTTHHIGLSFKNITPDDIVEIWWTVKQNGTVKIDKAKADMTQDNDMLWVNLSQEDTLSLSKGDAKYQSRMLLNDGEAEITKETVVHIMDCQKEGVIGETR